MSSADAAILASAALGSSSSSVSKDKADGTATASYFLSRASFVGTHAVFAYWLLFITNDPLGLGTNTLDVSAADLKPAGQCQRLIVPNLVHDVLVFGVWWAQHSIMARKAFKQATGLWQHPIERPLFAISAVVAWLFTLLAWRPITDCQRWVVTDVPLSIWAVSGTIFAAGALLLVSLLWLLPNHVFGTNHYTYEKGRFPVHGQIIRNFPYGLVRHPAAAGFLWMYWSLPAYTANHLLLAALWTVFIVVGTLFFEEGGLKGTDEFGAKYHAYSQDVAAFYPSPSYLRALCPVAGKADRDAAASAAPKQE